ncbi:MAG TPA: hypothetical protein VH372_15135 [Actinospica sp.]|nr:hypothetical protein [Actinospica sp.]
MTDSGDFAWDPFGTLHAALWIGADVVAAHFSAHLRPRIRAHG